VECSVGQTVINVIMSDTKYLRRGDKIFLKFDEQKMHFFDNDSGKAIR
jgi:hypothetical protein